MNDQIRQKGKLLLFVPLAFLFGLGLASNLEWTRGSQAAPAVRITLPDAAQVREANELSEAFIAISEAVTPAVVRIQAERSAGGGLAIPPGFHDLFGIPPGGNQEQPQLSGGSGFIISPEGYILTNNHVIAGSDRISVALVDKRTFDAEVVGRDPTTDVAVIKIDARGLPAIPMGDSEQARVGEWVLAIGNPGFGDSRPLDFTVTSGIVSAKGRPLEIIGRELQAHASAAASYAIEDFIQTDAVINPGNSGGPLVNLRGEVIGINTAIASGTGFYQGYGFAIPINLARRVMDDLIAHGRVRRALLGINIVNVTAEDAEVFGLPEIAGVLVEDFSDGSPARNAGLVRGDVIVAVNGHKVERVGQLQRLIAQHEPGEEVEVRAIRYGEPHAFHVRLFEAPIPTIATPRGQPAPRVRNPDDLGIEINDLTPALAREIGFESAGGAVITGVDPSSPAARKQIVPGYRVISIDRKPVESANQARAMLDDHRSGKVVSLVLEAPDGRTRIANIRVP